MSLAGASSSCTATIASLRSFSLPPRLSRWGAVPRGLRGCVLEALFARLSLSLPLSLSIYIYVYFFICLSISCALVSGCRASALYLLCERIAVRSVEFRLSLFLSVTFRFTRWSDESSTLLLLLLPRAYFSSSLSLSRVC